MDSDRQTPDALTQSDRLAAALAHAGSDPFVSIVSATRMAVAITDPRQPDNPVVFVNDSFTRLTGYSAAEAVGRNCRFLQGPATDPSAVAAVRAAVAAAAPIEIDLLNYRKDGTAFWNRLAIAPAFDADRRVTYLFASQIDVTDERARTAALENDRDMLAGEVVGRDDALRASDERLRRAAEAARIGVWEIALPDLTLTATPTLNAVYGFAPDFVPTVAAVRDITHPDDRAMAFDRFDAVAAGRTGPDYRTTYRIRRPDGRIGWVEARGEVIRAADGTPLRIVGVSQDVTAQREADARIELSEESLRLATDASGVGTWDLDLVADILTWTDRTRAMFGISPGVPVSMDDFRAGVHPDDLPATLEAFGAALDPAIRALYDVEYRTIGKEDGVVRWVAARGKGLFDGDRCVRAIGSVIDITRRHTEAEALRASETRLAASEAFATLLLDSTSEAFYSIDTTGLTTSCNPAFVTLLGFASAADAIGHRLHDVIHHSHPDGSTYAVAHCPIYRAASSGQPAHIVDEVFHRLDGTIVPVEYRAEPIWRDGVLCGAICTIVDITVRRAAEAERATSEARLRAVIEAAPVGLIFADPAGAILGGNAQVEQLMRHPVLPVQGVADYTDYVAYHPDGRQVAGHEYPLARALAGEERPELETLYRRGDGTLAYLRFIAAPIREAGGALTGAVVASLDIDAERRAELALRELNATLEQRVADATAARDAIWRESRDLLLIIDGTGIIEAVNPAWTETLGYAEVELLGHRYDEFVVTEDIAASDAALASITAAPLRDFENRYRHADGSIRDLAWTAAAGDSGKLYCVARDVTTKKTVERQLATAQEALRQAQKMEAVGQLTGGIAHDFNNMLAVVLGSLDLLGRRLGADDVRARRYVEAATDGARRAATLTQRLLAFSRQQPLQPEPVDVNRLVATMSDLLRGSLGGGVQLETVLAGGLWPVHADPNQLENVILNLGINARDAMDGAGRLTIETHNCHLDDRYVAAEIGVAAGQYVMIAVTDVGMGMAPHVIAKAFDPFFTTKGVGQGTGLGLSQVYGFVKQSGGHVKIYSEVGVGTTVKLYLPRLTGVTIAAPGAAAAETVVGGDLRELILVVDDEAGVRAVAVESLRDLGYRVIEADGAAAALALLETHDVALLFTDIVMPEVNGAKLAEAARARRPGLKVLFTTGYTRNAVVHNGVVDAGVDLIGKPFTFEALAAKVRSVLDGG